MNRNIRNAEGDSATRSLGGVSGVVTSGLDGIFPRGFGIGRVSSITQSPDGAQTIRLDPEMDYASLEEVLILLEPNAVDLLPAPTTEAQPQ